MTCSTLLSGKNRIILIAGILMVVITLRVTLTGAAPLLDTIHPAYSLTTAQTGLSTTLSLLVFVLISPLAAPMAQCFGMERSLFAALPLTCAGIAIRSLPSPYLLFGGTAIIGGGIALGNVLPPGLIKCDFPHSAAGLTGAYSLTMRAAAVLGSATVAPLVLNGLGQQGASLMPMCSPLLTLFLWLPQWQSQQHTNLSTSRTLHIRGIWRPPLAWQVTLFLGIDSLVHYVIIGWLPAILISHGYSGVQAGSLHGLLQLATAAPGLLVPFFLHHVKNQRGTAAFVVLMCAASAARLCFTPAHAITWTLLFGFGSGAIIVLGLMFIGLRTNSAHQVAALPGMAQSVGYSLAACRPPLMGRIHDVNDDWSVPPLGVTILLLLMTTFGPCAGRDEEIR